MCSGYKFSITYVLCKYFPSFHGLVFHSVNNVFHRMKVLHFDKFQFINFYTVNYAFVFFLFFNFTILYWFCHISTWIRHRYTRVPHPEPSSFLPPCTIPLGRPSATAPSIRYRAFVVMLNNSLLDTRPQRFSPLLSLRSFVILPFMFRLMIYFDWTVV